MGRIMGIDYGTHRVGVALSDPLHITAQPCEVVAVDDQLLDRLAAIVREHDVERIVVGLPVSLSGDEGPAAVAARTLAEEIDRRVEVDVELADERFTTKTAEEALLQGNVRRSRRKEVIDKVAAAVMLQQWLDRR